MIKKVDFLTDRINSMFLIKKPNNELKICLDLQDLNKALEREYFSLLITGVELNYLVNWIRKKGV